MQVFDSLADFQTQRALILDNVSRNELPRSVHAVPLRNNESVDRIQEANSSCICTRSMRDKYYLRNILASMKLLVTRKAGNSMGRIFNIIALTYPLFFS